MGVGVGVDSGNGTIAGTVVSLNIAAAAAPPDRVGEGGGVGAAVDFAGELGAGVSTGAETGVAIGVSAGTGIRVVVGVSTGGSEAIEGGFGVAAALDAGLGSGVASMLGDGVGLGSDPAASIGVGVISCVAAGAASTGGVVTFSVGAGDETSAPGNAVSATSRGTDTCGVAAAFTAAGEPIEPRGVPKLAFALAGSATRAVAIAVGAGVTANSSTCSAGTLTGFEVPNITASSAVTAKMPPPNAIPTVTGRAMRPSECCCGAGTFKKLSRVEYATMPYPAPRRPPA